VHWTYNNYKPDGDLEQGDIISRTDALISILQTVHPHFCADKYLSFVVTTQTCDLVRRSKGVAAKYLSIAVVRSLKDVIPRLLDQLLDPDEPGVYESSMRAEARRFLSRIFNQNEQAQGIFYLHPESEIGLGEPCVALLRVGVALRNDHYDALMQSRRGRLKPEFQAKFGWLIGNLYSRAATPDWAEAEGGKASLENLIVENLKPQIPGRGPVWVDGELLKTGRVIGYEISEHRGPELLKELEPLRPKPAAERIADEVVKVAKGIIEADDEVLSRFRHRLAMNSNIKKIIKAQ
jgi:hypothetical protein